MGIFWSALAARSWANSGDSINSPAYWHLLFPRVATLFVVRYKYGPFGTIAVFPHQPSGFDGTNILDISTIFGTFFIHSYRPVPVVFFSLDSGREPAREWLKALNKRSKRTIGEDIKTLLFGWPVGMPLARKLDDHLWELRSNLDNGIARIFFTVRDTKIVLLHGFIKKTQKTPARELSLARRRLNKLRAEQ